MVDESFISSLVLAATILLGIFSILSLINIFFGAIVFFPFLMDPLLDGFFSMILFSMILPSALSAFVGAILIVVWLGWRKNPTDHRRGLIFTGIIATLCCGILPGIVAIVAGAMEPKIAKTYTHTPPLLPHPTEMQCCPYCGASASPMDRFCWKCGSTLNP